MPLKEAAEGLTTARYRSPKTILGFFSVVMAIYATWPVVIVDVRSRNQALPHLIAPILVFPGALFLAVLAGILITAWKDPTILMLGEVSGEVFIQNRKLTLGDSTAGEFTELVVTASP